MANSQRPTRTRITVDAGAHRARSGPRRPAKGGTPEIWVAISVIVAGALATFLALYITSRPFDPMNASVAPQQMVPAGPSLSPTPKSSTTPPATPTPLTQVSPTTPGGEIAAETPDDATIQSRIEAALAGDPNLAKLDVSTLVENGKVTLVGSVRSADLKQRVERTIRAVRGVSNVDNQLVVSEATPS